MSQAFDANTYFVEVQAVAAQLAAECYETVFSNYDVPASQENASLYESEFEDEFTERLYETVDFHEFVIYYHNAESVYSHSNNAECYLDECGAESVAETLKNNGMGGLFCALAYFAMAADIRDYMGSAKEDYIGTLPESVEVEEEEDENGE